VTLSTTKYPIENFYNLRHRIIGRNFGINTIKPTNKERRTNTIIADVAN
jgi:hypothetical protein